MSETTTEPTTAEAFATVQQSMEACGAVHDIAGRALSLLERRMGAMDAALRGCRVHLKCTTGCVCDVCAALTDAPPVFTLEEAVSVFRGEGADDRDVARIRARFSALRRGGR
jgi:hypothetical protein